ncbi:hypothetical protein CHUAL_003658 [Chamberlinius hualienensis]
MGPVIYDSPKSLAISSSVAIQCPTSPAVQPKMVRDMLQSFSASLTSFAHRASSPPTFRVGYKKPQYGIYIRTSAIKQKLSFQSKTQPVDSANQVELFSQAVRWLLKQFTIFGFKTDSVAMEKQLRYYFIVTDIIVGIAVLSPILFLCIPFILTDRSCSDVPTIDFCDPSHRKFSNLSSIEIYKEEFCSMTKDGFQARMVNSSLLLSPVIFYITFRTKWNTICKILQILNCLSLGLKVKDDQQPTEVVKLWTKRFTIYGIVSIIFMAAKVIVGLVHNYGWRPLIFFLLFVYSAQLIVFHYLKILVQGLIITICIFIICKLRSYSRMNFRVVNQRQAWQEFHMICSVVRKLNDLINVTLFTTLETSIMRIPPFIKSIHYSEHFFDLDFKESIPCIIAFFANIICISVVNKELFKFGRSMWFKPKAETFPKTLPYPSLKHKLAALQEKIDQMLCMLCFKLDPYLITVYGAPLEIYQIIEMLCIVTLFYFKKSSFGDQTLCHRNVV